MIWLWLFICLVMTFSAATGFYVGALFEKKKLKADRLDDVKTQAYHLGNEIISEREKCYGKNLAPAHVQPVDVVKNMKSQDKKYCRLKFATKK